MNRENSEKKLSLETLCVLNSGEIRDKTGSVSTPIYQTSTFRHEKVGESTGFDYTRSGNPTRSSLERTVAALENGTDALAFSSGMAAVSALMELFKPGDHIIASDDLYGGTHRLFEHISSKNGLVFTHITHLQNPEDFITPNTKAVYIETPTNPLMHVHDLNAIAVTAKKHNLLFVVDNTFLTPYFQKPLNLGADIVVHSGTKFLGGHNDTLAGLLVTAKCELAEKLRFIQKTTGACLSPFDSWLVLRGIKTLAVRLDRQQETAKKIALWLQSHKKVKNVFYPGLPTDPGYEISVKQTTGFGGMISFEVESAELACRALENLRIISYAESLGGTESLMTYPMTQTHADIPEEERLRKGINERLLRLSVGLEAADDLIADLDKAFE
ncbi:cystathionine gamma-synthase [Clostridia bacterium]|nr:cystathionine gamma-synthase [Clostridia bacterium]